MVAVDVGDEETGDVTGRVAELAEHLHEQLARLRDRPAGVDQGDAALVVAHHIDVDRTQPVVGQRQRDAMDAVRDLLDGRLGPVGTGAGSSRHADIFDQARQSKGSRAQELQPDEVCVASRSRPVRTSATTVMTPGARVAVG